MTSLRDVSQRDLCDLSAFNFNGFLRSECFHFLRIMFYGTERAFLDRHGSTPLLHWFHHCISSSVFVFLHSLTHSSLFLPWRKRQLQFLLEGRGRRAGLSPEELRDNGKLLGEGLSRALFNYPSRDCSAESPEVSYFFIHKSLRIFTCIIDISNVNTCLPTAAKSCWDVKYVQTDFMLYCKDVDSGVKRWF